MEKAGWSAPAASRLPSPREKAVIPRIFLWTLFPKGVTSRDRRINAECEPGQKEKGLSPIERDFLKFPISPARARGKTGLQ
jgi:hypothetical protein